MLCEQVPHDQWVGYDLTDPQRPRELACGPCDGGPTEHLRILFGRGTCGQAAERGMFF